MLPHSTTNASHRKFSSRMCCSHLSLYGVDTLNGRYLIHYYMLFNSNHETIFFLVFRLFSAAFLLWRSHIFHIHPASPTAAHSTQFSTYKKHISFPQQHTIFSFVWKICESIAHNITEAAAETSEVGLEYEMWWNVVVWAGSWDEGDEAEVDIIKQPSQKKKHEKGTRGRILIHQQLSDIFVTFKYKSPLSFAFLHSFILTGKSNLYSTFSILSSHNRDRAAKLLKWWGYGSDGGRVSEWVRERKSRTRKYLSWKIAQRLCVKIVVWRKGEKKKFNHFRLAHVYIAHSTTFSRLWELCFSLCWIFTSRLVVCFGGKIIVARIIWFSTFLLIYTFSF